MAEIFGTEAPKYWAAGLPAIPLMAKDKRPAVARWQLFADTFPTDEEREMWLNTYAYGNIGLPMGPSAGLVAIDIDTDDPTVLRVLNEVLPPSPWNRVGRKGVVMVYRWNGERTTRIKNGADGSMICEILSKGTQIVLPPSIHPDTGKPYSANCPLYEVCKAVPDLPPGVEGLIREALRKVGIEVSVGSNNKITTFVPAGARDNAMVWHAGLLSRAILRGERTLVQAMGELGHWVENFVEQVVGDPITVEKAHAKLIEFLIRDVTGERKYALPVGWDEGLTDEDKDRLGLSFTDDDRIWTTQELMEYLSREFDRHPDFRSEGRIGAINVVLDRIARAGNAISALDEAMVLRFIASQSAGVMSQADLKRQLATLRRGDIAGDNQEQVADAVLKYLEKFGEVRFTADSFWQWKGAYWGKLSDMEVGKIIATEFGNYPVCKRHGDYMGVLRVMRDLANKPLNTNEVKGLNFANGFLNDKLELEPHHPDHGMTYVLPYRYRPEEAGHMPMFDQFLMDSWGEDPDYADKVLLLQEMMGATLMGSAPIYQKAYCLIGQPGSGKSRVAEIMMGLLPEGSYSTVPPQDWGDKFLPAQLFGKVMNFAGELSENKNIPGDVFKLIVEGSKITSQHKNMPPFEFKPICAQWFSSNYTPKTRDSSDGFNRRWMFLEWNKRVDPEKVIPNLDQIILEHETEAIAAWAVLGYKRLVEQGGYTQPTSHMARVETMAIENNSVRYFLTSCPTIVVGKRRIGGDKAPSMSLSSLHGEYWQFCLTTGTAQRVSLNKFKAMMNDLQATFGFQMRVELTPSGVPETYYDWIDYAKNV